MTRAGAGLTILLVLLLTSCGEETAAPCDDARFLDQSEELYVALAAADNASARAAPIDILVDDLRVAATVLYSHLDASPPCSDGLAALATDERAAAADLEGAASLLESDAAAARVLLDRALATLGSAEKRLR